MAESDYYKILQIDPKAEPEVIEAAYRRLARKYHPDVNKSPDAVQRMQQINVAYEVLRDPAKRAEYDRARLRRPFYGPRESPRYTTYPPRPARNPPILHVHPLRLDFGHLPAGETQTKTLHLTNRGGGTLGGNLEKTASWLHLNITKVHSNFTIVEVTVDTTDLPPTFYRERIEITSNGGQESVEVTLRVTAPTEPRPAAVTSEHAEAAQVFPSFWEWWFSPSWTLPVRLLVFALQVGIALWSFLFIASQVVGAFFMQPCTVGVAVFFTFPILFSPSYLFANSLVWIYGIFMDESKESRWFVRLTQIAAILVGTEVWHGIMCYLVSLAASTVMMTTALPPETPAAAPSLATATRWLTAAPLTPTDTPTPTATLTPGPPPAVAEASQVWASPIDGAEMVYVPAGEFTMGSDEGSSDEQPVHAVYLDAFYIDKHEVTNAQFAAFVSATGYETEAERRRCSWVRKGNSWECVQGVDWQHPSGPDTDLMGKDEHPVVQVSWSDAKAYCEWAGKRLPTEAEWEKACKGTDGRAYPWGDQGPTLNLCNFDENEGGTTPVGKYSPQGDSPYGCVDMAGNVEEWVADWYDEDYYSQSPARNPPGPDFGRYRVSRGCKWTCLSIFTGCAERGFHDPDDPDFLVGFRCARGVATTTPTPTPVPPTGTPTFTLTPSPASTPTAVLSPPTATPVPGALGFLEWANSLLDDLPTYQPDNIMTRYRDRVHISILDGDVGRVCRITVSPPPETGEDAIDLAMHLLSFVGLIEDHPSYRVGLDIVEVMYLREDGGLVFMSSDMPTIRTYLEGRITADEWYDTVDIHSRPYISPPTPEITYIATPGPLTAQDEALLGQHRAFMAGMADPLSSTYDWILDKYFDRITIGIDNTEYGKVLRYTVRPAVPDSEEARYLFECLLFLGGRMEACTAGGIQIIEVIMVRDDYLLAIGSVDAAISCRAPDELGGMDEFSDSIHFYISP
ncbi:MAG: hypothetical protein E3J21_22510 [Anaerolineales bacterium]|nr:MAG: hypothetical protein E3J21_22510 [Anaerolineales bacterium]